MISNRAESVTDVRIDSTRVFVEIEEEKYAGRAMVSDFLIPSPPMRTGKQAWFQASSLKVMLAIDTMELLTISSNSFRRSTSLYAGEDLRSYVSFGIDRECFNKTKA